MFKTKNNILENCIFGPWMTLKSTWIFYLPSCRKLKMYQYWSIPYPFNLSGNFYWWVLWPEKNCTLWQFRRSQLIHNRIISSILWRVSNTFSPITKTHFIVTPFNFIWFRASTTSLFFDTDNIKWREMVCREKCCRRPRLSLHFNLKYRLFPKP